METRMNHESNNIKLSEEFIGSVCVLVLTRLEPFKSKKTMQKQSETLYL